ncbi:MAG: MarR family winged helix-turn-helix transcriptional regulator [Betaproteobacteria bacterium]
MTRPASSTDHPLAAACACGRLRRASRAITQLYDDALAPSGLRITQFSLLRNLARGGTMRVTALAKTLLLDRTALSRTLDPLVLAGHVEIARGRDARTREVSITRAGRAALAAAQRPWKRAQADVTRRLGAAKLGGLIAALAELETLHPDAASRG